MKPTIPEKSEDFKNMCDLLSVYSEGSAQLKAMQGEMDSMFLSLVDDKKTEYAELQLAVTNAETGLEVIALRHPEWFTEKRIIKTPFGTVKFARSTVLEIKNEELTIELVKNVLVAPNEDPAGTKAQFIRQIEKLDVEALEKLDDDVLKLLKVKRVQKDNFSVVAASVDLGKAVKEAAGKEVAA
jgi:hypothetical protein